jgi:AraC-like DNA-binding protein
MDYFSTIEKLKLRWIKKLSWSFIIISILLIILNLIPITKITTFIEAYSFFYAIIALLIYLWGYFALNQPQIFLAGKKLHYKKYKKSAFKKEDSTILKARLEAYLETEQPFLNPELSLQKLAKEIGFSVHHLSQLINEHYQMNFYKFVNSYRINWAKALLTDPERRQESILSIAFDSGFNSKTSFNRIFKEFVGTTPSKYKISSKF